MTDQPYPSIRDAVREQLDAGIADPHVIAERVIAVKTERWVQYQLVSNAQKIIADIARQVIDESRRKVTSQIGSSSPGRTRVARYGTDEWGDFLQQSVYVPGVGWRLHRDLTADDCRAVAEDRRETAAKNLVWAERYDTFAVEIDAAGVVTLGDLQEEIAA